MKTVYLAIPYSFNPNFSNRIVNKVAAKLMSDGYAVYSPISQGHVIADHLDENLRRNSDWWTDKVIPFVSLCDQFCIISIGEKGYELIDASKGCVRELTAAMRLGKPVKQIEVNEHGEILNIVG